jgi:phage tail-like protein
LAGPGPRETDGRVTGAVTATGRGFRSTVRVRLFAGPGPRPESLSARATMRDALPALYREHDPTRPAPPQDPFAMRFVGALECVLDPIVAILDAMPAYISAESAPHDLLELLTAWLGLEIDETQPHEHRRELIRRAAELGRSRGTAAGLELALRLAFPETPFRVEDRGGVVWALSADGFPPCGPPEVVVYCLEAPPEERLVAIARFIERARPVHVNYKLRVKVSKGEDDAP